MASQTFITSLMFLIVVGISEVACKQQKSCGLFEYYDRHMDDCGPCQEICDKMEVKGTEKQCKSQCSHYLVAVTCTYIQYYDEVVSSCAPCSEICKLSDVKGTTGECAGKCPNYLKAQNCTEKEYFDDTVMECSSCSQLCSQRDKHGDTNRDCFIKCHQYIEDSPLVNIIKDDNSPKDPSHAKSRADPAKDDTSMHPGIILTLVIGFIVVALTVAFVVYWMKTRRPAYTPAPSIEANIGDDEKNDDVVEQVIHMEDPNTESMQHAATTAPGSIRGGRQEGGNTRNGVKIGIQERNPKASGNYSFSQLLPTRETVL